MKVLINLLHHIYLKSMPIKSFTIKIWHRFITSSTRSVNTFILCNDLRCDLKILNMLYFPSPCGFNNPWYAYNYEELCFFNDYLTFIVH